VVQALDRAFTASHDLSDLGIRHVFDKFQDEQILSFTGQAPDEFEKRFLLL
jgi:hypothetical protein